MTKPFLAAFALTTAVLPHSTVGAQAPMAGPDARYCLYVAPVTGSQVETVQCWTRQQWADQDVDVDREWAREGVRVIG